jgi:hypothetical protein
VITPPDKEIHVRYAIRFQLSGEENGANGIVSAVVPDFKNRRGVNMPTPAIDYHRAWLRLLKKGESKCL